MYTVPIILQANMEAYDAIMTRRSVPKVTEEEPSRAAIERLLAAAVRAPTHHLTQPWRFEVLRGDALDDLAKAWSAGSGDEFASIAAKTHRAPVIITVIEHPKTSNARVVEVEEHHATGAAIQNILLAAHAAGLGAMIRTGPAAWMPEVREYLGVAGDEIIAAFIYLGYPRDGDEERPMTRRTDAIELTGWRGF